MKIIFEFITGMMFGIELIEGGVVLDLVILRIMFLHPDSPYCSELGL